MNMNKNLIPGKFHNLSFDIKDVFLNKNVIDKYLSLFWNSIMNQLNEQTYVLISFRLLYITGCLPYLPDPDAGPIGLH